MIEAPGLIAALVAGLLSFLSPCILPLVPFYLGYLGAGAGAGRRVALARATAFAVGMTAVFAALGLSATAVGRILQAQAELLRMVAGLALMLFGARMAGLLRLPLLPALPFSGRARSGAAGPPEVRGLIGAALIGGSFALGWTPCAGPLLAAILFLAAERDSLAQGALLLVAYGLAMSLPFVAIAAAAGPALAALRRHRAVLARAEVLSGVLLMLFGLLLLTGWLVQLGWWLYGLAPELWPAL